MNLFRLSGVCLAVLLISACDKEPPQPPKAPVPAPPSVSAPAQPNPAAEPAKPEPAPVTKPAPKATTQSAPAPTAIAQKLVDPNALEQHAASLDKASSKATSSKATSSKAKDDEVKPVVRAPQPPDKIQRLHANTPQTAQQRKATEAVKKQKLEKPKLDLRLPKDLVNKLEPEVADTKATSKTPAPTLLPQMFADKPAQQSSFEMGGRIITNDHSRDVDKDASYWDTVDGAELQFKFNH